MLAVALLLPGSMRANAAGPSPLLERFEQGYQRVLSQAAAGALPASAEGAAIELRTALLHELVDRDSALERLKREALRAGPAEREALLDQVAEAGAARERLLHDYLRRLQGLQATGRTESASGTQPAETGAPVGPEFNLQIESRPEDPTLGRFE